MKAAQCPITGEPAEVEERSRGDWRRFHSPAAGGVYDITRSAEEDARGSLPKSADRLRVVTWLTEQRLAGVNVPRVTTTQLDPSALPGLPKIATRIERMYRFLKRELPTIRSSLPLEGNLFRTPEDKWTSEQVRAYLRAWTASGDDEEFRVLIKHGVEEGRLTANRRIALTIPGWQYVEGLDAPAPSMQQPLATATEAEPIEGPAAATKSIFISYSWDSDAHKQWVRRLAERLVNNGVHVHLDQWDVTYGESLTQFMENLPSADFVAVVCTPTYARKSLQRRGGVGYEAQIISAQVAAGVPRSRFIPILRAGGLAATDPDCGVPPHFQGIMLLDMREDSLFDEMFEELLRHIYGQPLLMRPPLGSAPSFGPKRDVALGAVRLANFEVEGWELLSGVAHNEMYPATFHIPDEAGRREVAPGDFVKLMFHYVYSDEETAREMNGGGERMWVEVESLNGPYFVGRLRNQPTGAAEHDLAWGSRVVFLPEHIITIDRGGKDAEAARAKLTEAQKE